MWYLKLPAEWKALFEELAEQDGDTEYGAGARYVRKTLRKMLDKNKESE